MVNTYIPEKGDIVFLNFNPQSGHEQAGKRPALVISPSIYNRIGLAVLCPITKQVKNYPFEVALSEKLATKGVVLSDQIKSLDWQARKASFIEKCPQESLEKVIEHLTALLITNE